MRKRTERVRRYSGATAVIPETEADQNELKEQMSTMDINNSQCCMMGDGAFVPNNNENFFFDGDIIYTYYNPLTHQINPLPDWNEKDEEDEDKSEDEADVSIVKTISQPMSKRARKNDILSQMMSQVKSQTRKRLNKWTHFLEDLEKK